MVEDNKTKSLVRHSILMAMTVVMTMVIRIPSIGTEGYLNLGDMVVFLSAFMLGKKGGFIVGGLGSAMADILLGYTHYAPITLIVKGLEGFVAGSLMETGLGKKNSFIPVVIGGLVMALGYYIAEVFMYGAGAALVSVPGNAMQGLLGAVLSVILYKSIIGKIIK